MLETIKNELKSHAPFTAFGAVTGILILLLVIWTDFSGSQSASVFWSLHPAHVFLSALVTAGMYRLHSEGTFRGTLVIGYLGSVGVATISDSIIPFLAELILDFPNRGVHIGFLEKWWLINPLAVAGILVAYHWPTTRIPHAGHVLLSTWASLFHMTMAMEDGIRSFEAGAIFIFLFLAVWTPCCTSDIVFPLVFTGTRGKQRS